MEKLGLDNMRETIAAKIMVETKRLNNLADSGQRPFAEDVKPISLEDFREAFDESENEFLSDELLNRVLDEFKNGYDSMKEYYPEGTKLLVAALPCNINGMVLSDEDMENGEYLTAFVVNESTGLSTGFGALRPTTHAKMLPEEIQKQCSFKVHYDSDTSYADEKDFEQFAEQYRNAYHKLQKLLKADQ